MKFSFVLHLHSLIIYSLLCRFLLFVSALLSSVQHCCGEEIRGTVYCDYAAVVSTPPWSFPRHTDAYSPGGPPLLEFILLLYTSVNSHTLTFSLAFHFIFSHLPDGIWQKGRMAENKSSVFFSADKTCIRHGLALSSIQVRLESL